MMQEQRQQEGMLTTATKWTWTFVPITVGLGLIGWGIVNWKKGFRAAKQSIEQAAQK